MQDRIKSYRVGALRVCTEDQIFQEKSVVRVLEVPLTYRVIHVNSIKGTLMQI